MPRDSFRKEVIEAIAKRSGYRCAFPHCQASTVGPGDVSTQSTNSVGVACHIAAASPGGPRYDDLMKPEERASTENGIWMCATHSREIDNDVVRFPLATLRAWKLGAESRARDSLGRPTGPTKTGDPLVAELVEIMKSTSDINRVIGEAMTRSGAHEALGDESACAIRDALVEAAKNAFEHGKADKVTVSIEPRRIWILDNGNPFDPTTLPDQSGRGGRRAFQAFRERHPDLLSDYHRHGAANRLVITPLAHMPPGVTDTPCTMVIQKPSGLRGVRLDTTRYAGCGTVFVSLPEYMSPSDAYSTGQRLCAFSAKVNCELTLIASRYSATTIEILREFLPTARIVSRKSA